ncbi:MAG: GH3 auxin-responsive promoter family protein, partial [Bdellovibrionales bacterium]|nr:GH3 auxin-responsive promoter family protein [Bdellovibrionales bacterium]
MLDLTPFLRTYSWFRSSTLDKQDPTTTQLSTLLKLTSKATNTTFGRDHSFSAIRSVEDFQRQVPLRKYEDFWEQYWKPVFPVLQDCTWPGLVPYFPVSSGTS